MNLVMLLFIVRHVDDEETKNADASKRACTEEVKRSGGGVVFLDIIRHKSNGLYIRLNHR